MKKLGDIDEVELVWVTANGRKMTISEMDTTHIKNSINKILASGGVWRGEFLEPLERELERRNLSVADEKVLDTVTEEEKIYFLETSCEYVTVKLRERLVTDKKLAEFLNNYFVIDPEETTKEQFIKELENDLDDPKLKNDSIYKKYSKYILDNVFTREWKNFIDLMLGRRNRK